MSVTAPGRLAGRLTTGLVWALLLAALWVWGCALAGESATSSSRRPPAPVPAAPGGPARWLPPAAPPLPGAAPRRVDLPRLGVRAPVTARGLDAHGGPAAPPYAQAGAVGWYAAGVRPGAAGPALLVGHRDTETRPAVFHRLAAARPGDTVRVLRADGRIAEFTVDDVETVPVDRFDARRAYGPRVPGRAELRLLTCGGAFDRASGTYAANVIVSAYLTGPRG
ncbi:class F sortase [Streptomyces sp. NPDC091281]|uniref:class F sortase n=1 Tax=Streptomyces sp. NPDC091281 TaxID=3365985 RepID=UPI0038115507